MRIVSLLLYRLHACYILETLNSKYISRNEPIWRIWVFNPFKVAQPPHPTQIPPWLKSWMTSKLFKLRPPNWHWRNRDKWLQTAMLFFFKILIFPIINVRWKIVPIPIIPALMLEMMSIIACNFGLFCRGG